MKEVSNKVVKNLIKLIPVIRPDIHTNQGFRLCKTG